MNKENIIKEAHRVLLEESRAIANLTEQNSENIADAVSLILSANKIICTGVGKSGIIAQKIAATFSSIGMPSIFLHPVEALHGDIGAVQENDVTIMLSKSGSTEELVKLFPFLKSKTKIISITSNKNSYISSNSDIWLNAVIEKEACPINLAPMTSTTVALALGDALAACIVKAREFSPEDFSKNHPLGQLGRNLTLKVSDIMHSGSNLPQLQPESSFKEAIIEMTDKGLGCVCIISNNKLAGIITDGDIRRILTKTDDIRNLKLEEFMTKNPVSTFPEALLGDALSQMEDRKSQISVLPVVDSEEKLVGVIRIHDIIKGKIS